MSTFFESGFVLNPDPYYKPAYRISPFNTSDLAKNMKQSYRDDIFENLDRRFKDLNWRFTKSGKESIKIALETLGLNRKDCVTILTTSGNSYISKCVTDVIEKVCAWSREINSKTSAIFVNHEFGYPYRKLSSLLDYGVPIIEDACHSYFSNTTNLDMSHVGEFTIFSLPKAYPVQIGGLLIAKKEYEIDESYTMDSTLNNYLISTLSNYINDIDKAALNRIKNYNTLTEKFSNFGCTPYFEKLDNDVPGVFLFNVPKNVNLNSLKDYGWQHGIECSVFYGENAFFIPIHQRLTPEDLNYFEAVFKSYLTKHV